MESTKLLLFLVLSVMVGYSFSDRPKPKTVTCYYRNWAQHGREKAKFLPEMIDPKLCNVIKFAFLRVNVKTNKIESKQANDAEMLARLNKLKKVNPNLKIVIAIGGWSHEYEPRFSMMSATKTTRMKFIRSVLLFLRKHKVDGISINWIYPGTRHMMKFADKERQKFTMLIRDTYNAFKLDAQRTRTPRYYLSATVSPYKNQIPKSYDVPNIKDFVDSVDVMMNSLWSHTKRRTGTSSALTGAENTIIDSLNAWLMSGMPAQKLSVGFILYGQTYLLVNKNDHAIGSRVKGPGPKQYYTRAKGVLGYYEICSRTWPRNTTWQESKTKTAYLSDEEGLWVSYDSPGSFNYKLMHILDKYNLRGVTVWALDFDDFTGSFCQAGKYPVLREVSRVTRGDPCQICRDNEICKVSNGEATCSCAAGYKLDAKSGQCKKVQQVFKAEMKLDRPFTQALNNPDSEEFKSLKSETEFLLTQTLEQQIPGLVGVEVYGFKSGSVIVLYKIIVAQPEGAMAPGGRIFIPSAKSIEAAVKKAMDSKVLSALKVDKAFSPAVKKGSAMPTATCRETIDLGFIMDASGSMKSDFAKEKGVVKVIASSFGLSETGTHAGVITFSDEAVNSIKLNDHYDLSSFNEAVDKIAFMGQTTRIDKAFRLAQNTMFSDENGARDDKKDVLIFLTDGTQTDGRDSEYPGYIADELRDEGIHLIIVGGIGNYVHYHELEHIAGGPENTFMAGSFSEMLGSNVIDGIKERSCPSTSKKEGSDIIFLLDGSRGADFDKEKEFVKLLADSCGIKENTVHAGVLTYSAKASVSIRLNDHYNLESFNKAVDDISAAGMASRVAMPLFKAQTMFQLKNGGRPGVRKVALVIGDGTQGKSADALDLAGAGIEVVTVNVMSILPDQGNLAGTNTFGVSSYDELTMIIPEVSDVLCPASD